MWISWKYDKELVGKILCGTLLLKQIPLSAKKPITTLATSTTGPGQRTSFLPKPSEEHVSSPTNLCGLTFLIGSHVLG